MEVESNCLVVVKAFATDRDFNVFDSFIQDAKAISLIAKQWHPSKFKNKQPQISHLLFADDILLFSKANTHSIHAINIVLTKFCIISGMKINFDKLKAWFSRTAAHSTIHILQNTLNIRQSLDLSFYLGYPLKPTCKKSNLNFILDKLDKKLQGWKANLLSKIGRTQLTDSTISSLSNHIMQALLLSKSILSKIESKSRNFFWGHSNNVRKIHTLGLEKIAKPKKLGGLGIRRAEH